MAVEDEWSFAFWPEENSPIDVVFRQRKPLGKTLFEFVQLKEVVPEDLNPRQSLQRLLDSLPTKYPYAGGISIGIHINRIATTDLDSLRLPLLNGGSIWLFGFGIEPPHDSFLIGDLVKTPTACFFTHPRFLPGESPTKWKTLLDNESTHCENHT